MCDKRVLIIGSGGREHAISWKLSLSEKVSAIFVLPGSPGIGQVDKVKLVDNVDVKNFPAITACCKENRIDMVVVGPEDPLANGVADELTANGILCFGPMKAGARIESDKEWAKRFMIRHEIPTAKFETFRDANKAKEFIRTANFDALVVKASGLATGKGVIVAENVEQACAAVDEILGNKKFGSAGDVVVIEEKLEGEEVSCLAFVDTTTVKAMLPSQDHKRLKNEDIGPNTGGMGAYCPCPLISADTMKTVVTDVLQKAVDGLRAEGIEYRGVLYAGLMLTPHGPKNLEFNCRFGDPEVQVILPLLESDLFEIMLACCTDKLADVELKWKTNTNAVGVVMASRGYPETSTKGCVINHIDDVNSKSNHIVFHSGIAKNSANEFVTNGGRVLIAVAMDKDLKKAAQLATADCQTITFDGSQYRTDIASKGYKAEITYKSSGVNIDAGDALVQRIKPLARGTHRPGVIGGLGGFGGLFRLNDVKYRDAAGVEQSYKDPVLVQGTDGVGTKLKIALANKIYDTIGIDLVAMCVNDVLCVGAEPLAFLDYIACGKLEIHIAAQIVKGIAEACRKTRCALLGGETAEMPALYEPGKYDLAGYCVGVVDHDQILPKIDQICEGDLVIGIPSSGVHSNGFSLVNRLMESSGESFSNIAPFSTSGLSYAQEFLRPTRLYVSDVLPIIRLGNVKAVAHITGGGLVENIPRILPKELGVEIDASNFKILPVFGWLAAKGNVTEREMLRTFNCGIGMVLIVPATDLSHTALMAKGATVIGRVVKHSGGPQVLVKNFKSELDVIANDYRDGNSVESISYKDSGVHIEAGEKLVDKIKPDAKSTHRSGVLGGLGGFGGLFRLSDSSRLDPNGEKVPFVDPILVLGTDGVGTKLKIAQTMNNHKTVGIDLVAMCVNDILCNGADPVTFLDYYACGKLDVNMAADVISGIAEGCRRSGSTLIGGETAEMPGMYEVGDYDLAGFSLGIVENSMLLPKIEKILEGDLVIGLPSSGIHSNGFSLIHNIMKRFNLKMDDVAPFSPMGKTFGEELLEPTKIYVTAVQSILKTGLVKALAHITGGGLIENIPRILPENLGVNIDAQKFSIPPIFSWIASKTNLSEFELLRTFNCGIGLVLIVPKESETEAISSLYGFEASVIGTVTQRNLKTQQVVVNNFGTKLESLERCLALPRKRIGVLISGTGSNLQALIDASRSTSSGLFADIVLVLSNKAGVFGLERARKAGIAHTVVSHTDYKTREEFDEIVSQYLEDYNIDIVCLAGFMRILSIPFVRKWKGRLINVHPSLLPKYKGMHAQRQALEAGDKISGCSVHFVDENVDTGAVIVQEIVPITPDDTEQTLTEKIHKVEHIAFPKALRLLATDAVGLKSGEVVWH